MITKKYSLYLAWAGSFIATFGSLFVVYVLHWTPCDLCWYQRSMMYPIFVILTVAILRETPEIEYMVLPIAFIGFGISFYQNLLMYKIIPESLIPCTNGVSCTIPYHFYFNFLTLPLTAFLTFLIIIIAMFVYRKAKV